MIRIYVRNVEEDFARGVDRTDASWDAVIILLAGIIEKYVTKLKKVTSVVLAAFFFFALCTVSGFFSFTKSLAFVFATIFPIMGSGNIITAV